eukprot:4382304-Pyramimonas_sp.AAC.1
MFNSLKSGIGKITEVARQFRDRVSQASRAAAEPVPKGGNAAADTLHCCAEIPEPITECHSEMKLHEFAEVAIKMTKYTEVDPFNYYIYTDAS